MINFVERIGNIYKDIIKKSAMGFLKNKKHIVIISGAITLLIYFFVIQPVYDMIKYRHHAVFGDYKRYLWLLSDTIHIDDTWSNDPRISVTGMIREADQHFAYNLKGGNDINLLEINDLYNVKMSNVKFNFHGDFSTFKKTKVGILNQNIKGWPELIIKNKLPFNNKINVNFDPNATLKEIKDTVNCKAYFGKLTTMSLSNGEDEHLVLFDFSSVPQSLIAFYATELRFFVIIITSDHAIDESCINLLKLK